MRLESTYTEHHPNFGEGRLYAEHGYVHYGVDKRRTRVFIHNIEVDASHRGHGIGSALLDAVANRYPDHDMDLGYTTDQGEALWQSWLRKRASAEPVHEIAMPKWSPPAFDTDGSWRAKHDQNMTHFEDRVRKATGLSEDTPKWEVHSAWERGMEKALAHGHLDIGGAREKGFSGDARMMGEESYDWESGKKTYKGGYRPLPAETYHTTTGLSSVQKDGLKTPDELGHRGGHGLGGANSARTISVTTDKNLAHDIYHSLHERHAFLNGKMDYDDLINTHHGGAPQEKIRDGINRLHLPGTIEQWKRGMTSQGDRDPEHPEKYVHGPDVGIHTEDEFKQQYGNHWRLKPNTPGITADFPDGQKHYTASEFERPVTPHDERDHREEFYKAFSNLRHRHGGHRDPLFISTDPHAFAAKDPKDFAVLHVTPRDGAQGYPNHYNNEHDDGPDSGEWRTHSGEKLGIGQVEQPTPRHQIERGEHKTALRFTAMNGPDEMPPKMGESPIPEGTIRCYHNTWGRHIPGIRENGLLESHAKGDGGMGAGNEPSAGVWAATGHPAGDDKMQGPHVDSDRHTVEFWAHPDQISTRAEHHWNNKPEEWGKGYHHVIMNGDVPPHQITAIHEPWHSAARYMAQSEDPEKEYGWIRDNDNAEFKHYKKGLDYLTRPFDGGHKTAATEFIPGQQELFGDDHKGHLPNPVEGGHDWHHGTPKDILSLKQEHPDDPDGKDVDYEAENNRHWNSYLGDHWTSMRGVGESFAKGGYHHANDSDKGQGNVFTANLGIKNPKVYRSESKMDSEAVHHAWNAYDAHDPSEVHNEVCDKEDCHSLEDHESGDLVDTRVQQHYENPSFAAHWLGTHHDKENIAWNFKNRLRSQGHDGIVYGNEVEGPSQHPCAITFGHEQVHNLRRSGITQKGFDPRVDGFTRPTDSHKWYFDLHDRMDNQKTGSTGDDYRMEHRPADDEGAPAHDLTGNGTYPDDVYTHSHYYGTGDDEHDAESWHQLRRVKGKPDGKVRVYRSMPAEHIHHGIRPGDWVTTSKSYARQHGVHATDPNKDWPVIRATVRADEIHTNGDSINEWGYNGERPRGGMVSFKGGRDQEVSHRADGSIRPVVRRKEGASDEPDFEYETALHELVQTLRRDNPHIPADLLSDALDKNVEKAHDDHLLRHHSRWLPHERVFGPTKTTLDPRLFDGDTMKDEVRRAIMSMLNRCLSTHGLTDWQNWLRVFLAGSESTFWWGNNDFDTLLGCDYDALKRAHPDFMPLSIQAISDHFNAWFRAELNNEGWTAPWDVDGGLWHLTFYLNPMSWDIRQIQPYGAYSITDDAWIVRPPVLPEHKPEDFDNSIYALAEKYVERVKHILGMAHGPRRKAEADALYQFLHSDRGRAFSPRGHGWTDPGNLVWKYLDMHPDNLLGQLIEARK
jgi:hypothetical protein